MWTYSDVMELSEAALQAEIARCFGPYSFEDTLQRIRTLLNKDGISGADFSINLNYGGEWRVSLGDGRLWIQETHESMKTALYRVIFKYLLFESGLYELPDFEQVGSGDR